ncbi:MAG: c-type cytochrome domain-containing protein, partial [Myxococcota bacterium]|nr:c-type cytochrome domain-containing protein [Myxococcota bacterium]
MDSKTARWTILVRALALCTAGLLVASCAGVEEDMESAPFPTTPAEAGPEDPSDPAAGTTAGDGDEPGVADPAPGSPGQGTPDESAPGQGTPDQGTPGQGGPGQDTPGQDTPGQDTSGQDTSGQDTPGQGAPGQDGPEICGSFGMEIRGVLEAACVSCHGEGLTLGGLDLSGAGAYDALVNGMSASGFPFVVPGDLAGSYLVAKLSQTPPDGATMPPPPNMLTQGEIDQVNAWILGGAPNGPYGDCDEAPQVTPVSYDVVFEVDCEDPAPGNLVIALYESYPSAVPPVKAGQLDNVTFPVAVQLPGVAAGSYVAELTLDVPPFDPQNKSEGDLVAVANIQVPVEGSVVVTLVGAEDVEPEVPVAPVQPAEPEEPAETEPAEPEQTIEGPCGVCAPGTTCGADPSLPEYVCAGEPGSCGELDYGGTCYEGDVLFFCSEDGGSGSPVSLDCGLNEEASACGESSPGFFDCIEPLPPGPFEVPGSPETVTFADVHPILVKSCSGWVCHQYSGFAQADILAAYDAVIEKDFADDILESIVTGVMPAGNFGGEICSGDPSQDTNPKCLTQEEQDLVKSWVIYETGEDPTAEVEYIPGMVVSFTDVHPILNEGCSGIFCHSGGLASDDLDQAFSSIVDKNLCEPILSVIQSGAMPPNKGCTGDPLQDANIPGCLGVGEHEIILQWVT